MIRSESALVVLSTIALSGCAAVLPPHVLVEDPVTAGDIIEVVQCELADVYKQRPDATKLLRPFVASAELKVGLGTMTGSSPTVTVSSAAFPASAKFPLGASLSTNATRKTTLDFSVPMSSLQPATDQGRTDAVAYCAGVNARVVDGGLGLTKWLVDTSDALSRTGAQAKLGALTIDVLFSVTTAANGGLTFKTDLVDVDVGKPNAGNSDVNELTVTLAVPPPPSNKKAAPATPSLQPNTTIQLAPIAPFDRLLYQQLPSEAAPAF